VSNFIMQARQNQPITIYGDGSQTRSFCYVDDLIEASVRLMNTPDDFAGPVNTGNPNEFTIKELAEKIIDLTRSALGTGLQATAQRRPHPTSTGHHRGAGKTRLGAYHAAGNRPGQNNRLFRRIIGRKETRSVGTHVEYPKSQVRTQPHQLGTLRRKNSGLMGQIV
jgi:nucleoside-diphosphate-sugar epimerase